MNDPIPWWGWVAFLIGGAAILYGFLAAIGVIKRPFWGQVGPDVPVYTKPVDPPKPPPPPVAKP